jgi:hypothetical protein
MGSYGTSNRGAGGFKGTGKTRGFRVGQPTSSTMIPTKSTSTRKVPTTSAVSDKKVRKAGTGPGSLKR